MTQFDGAALPEAPAPLNYEQTLDAVLSLIGRPVLVLFSGSDGKPFITGVLNGRLDRGEVDERLEEVLLRDDAVAVETLFFHVGSRQTGFVLRPDEFTTSCWHGPKQLTIHLGTCAVTLLVQGDLDRALLREAGQRVSDT